MKEAKGGLEQLDAALEGILERPTAALAYVKERATEGDPASVLSALDDFAENRGFLINVGPVKGRLLAEAVVEAGVEARILELGCFCGYSAVLMARLLEGAGHVVSVEKSETCARAASEIVAFAGVSERVDILHSPSTEAIPGLRGPFDLVFLDHWKGLYRVDLEAIEAAGLLRVGSIVFADNVGPLFNPQEYLDYVRGCGRYDSRYVESTVEYTELEDAAEISVFRGA